MTRRRKNRLREQPISRGGHSFPRAALSGGEGPRDNRVIALRKDGPMVATMQRVKDDSDLRQTVLNEIRQKPELAEADVSVAADQGVLTLTGVVQSDADRIAVEAVAKQVLGVSAIADDLEVKPSRARSDTEVARDVLKAIRSHIFLSAEHVRAIVRDGCVVLEGEVHSELQRMLVEAEVKRLHGVSGISNHIEVKPEAFAEEPKSEFETSVQTGFEGAALFDNADWIESGEAEAG
jgi:osmotically-inducible protein OsmY